jgi:hypothetical protein
VTARFVDMGKALQSRIRDFFDSPLDAAATPLELVRAVLADLERKVEPVGRGRRVFPYDHVHVRLGPVAAERPALQAAFDGLGGRFQERLRELQCTPPSTLDVRVSFLKKPPAEWNPAQLFSVECRSDADPSTAPREDRRPRRMRLTVVKGAATEETYAFAQSVISIGRTAEPTDGRGRVRRNDVVFLDNVDGVTETVGRAHARLQLDGKTGEYRMFNEAASNPTFIIRDGATIQVPARDPRGVRVCAGDEIQIGRAVIRVAFDAV